MVIEMDFDTKEWAVHRSDHGPRRAILLGAIGEALFETLILVPYPGKVASASLPVTSFRVLALDIAAICIAGMIAGMTWVGVVRMADGATSVRVNSGEIVLVFPGRSKTLFLTGKGPTFGIADLRTRTFRPREECYITGPWLPDSRIPFEAFDMIRKVAANHGLVERVSLTRTRLGHVQVTKFVRR